MTSLPIPGEGPEAAAAWVDRHLDALCEDRCAPSPLFRGGQRAADAALRRFDVRGYAARRNEVWPVARRAASRLSPYIRHGLLSLPRVWARVASGPARDRATFRDELLWQEYARHLYARLGRRLARPLRARVVERPSWAGEPWPREMACVGHALDALERDGWVVNQARMWLASHWTVRQQVPWRPGEERFFRHLLDGSRAANRLGWQWVVGTGTGRPYAFSRAQVERRAPGMCAGCSLRERCPIERAPAPGPSVGIDAAPALQRDPDLRRSAGPEAPLRRGAPTAVWITAESLGQDDPALSAHPDLPASFVFDRPLLARLQLSRKRLVFLVETLAELARARPLQLHLGDPAALL
ncbi:MAG: deoxyribodipyrimidine photolyase, partial [Gammaproteobacteria bacterium]|nr:deoxyribodipyrimidine photolyase [Gammaproteobacteria bacterium]